MQIVDAQLRHQAAEQSVALAEQVVHGGGRRWPKRKRFPGRPEISRQMPALRCATHSSDA